MSETQGISRELSLGDVISKTFTLYRRYLKEYLIIFAITEGIIGILLTVLTHIVVEPTASASATLGQETALLGSLLEFLGLILLIGLAISAIGIGAAIKMTSEEITGTKPELRASVMFAISKLPRFWAVAIITGVLVFVGLLAILVPGFILLIMLSLAIPALLIENTGILASIGRSRRLVSNRWLKTFALAIVLGIIIGVAGLVTDLIGSLFGPASQIVSSILSATYVPLSPIALTVYYYSNVARLAPPSTEPVTITPGVPGAAMPVTGTRYCPRCGTQVSSVAVFCPNCGIRLPT